MTATVKLWRCKQCAQWVPTEQLHSHLLVAHQTRALDSALPRFFDGGWRN